MNRKVLTGILVGEACLLLALLVFVLGMGRGWWTPQADVPTEPTSLETPTLPTTPTEPPTAPPTEPPTALPTELPTAAPTEPEPVVYTLTFAGDCTLGTAAAWYNAASSFPAVMGGDYGYPFANVQPWFGSDDCTFVNLEGPLTDVGSPEEKEFAFRGSPDFVNILTEGSVEWVSLANNHSEDYGIAGYERTEEVLTQAGVAFAGDGETSFLETPGGLKIGVLAVAFGINRETMAEAIGGLRDQGAEIVVVSFHFGTEGSYHPTYDQQSYAHGAIDAGADIVFGHHPHVLQPMETYGDGVIFYSLGNFSFGGNSLPRDFDTAVISVEVIRELDGTVHLGAVTPVPCSISSVSSPNNYQPTPAAEGSERYDRVLEKLSGTYDGPDIVRETEPETEPETVPETAPETEPETVPETTPETEPETTAG